MDQPSKPRPPGGLPEEPENQAFNEGINAEIRLTLDGLGVKPGSEEYDELSEQVQASLEDDETFKRNHPQTIEIDDHETIALEPISDKPLYDSCRRLLRSMSAKGTATEYIQRLMEMLKPEGDLPDTNFGIITLPRLISEFDTNEDDVKMALIYVMTRAAREVSASRQSKRRSN